MTAVARQNLLEKLGFSMLYDWKMHIFLKEQEVEPSQNKTEAFKKKEKKKGG